MIENSNNYYNKNNEIIIRIQEQKFLYPNSIFSKNKNFKFRKKNDGTRRLFYSALKFLNFDTHKKEAP